MCDLINDVVIKGGYFDTSRPLNSCEANVAFGASETIYSAFEDGLLDAAVIVSNNLGTIIATNASATQGAVKRMTGLFYTSPSAEIMKTAEDRGLFLYSPTANMIIYTYNIHQLLKPLRSLSRISVTVESAIYSLNEICRYGKRYDMLIYKFGFMFYTGIDEASGRCDDESTRILLDPAHQNMLLKKWNANAIRQVGVKIPVHIKTKQAGTLNVI
jgi:hypothetical protein